MGGPTRADFGRALTNYGTSFLEKYPDGNLENSYKFLHLQIKELMRYENFFCPVQSMEALTTAAQPNLPPNGTLPDPLIETASRAIPPPPKLPSRHSFR